MFAAPVDVAATPPPAAEAPTIHAAFTSLDAPSEEEVEDEEEAECRVCRGEAEPDRRLYAPCKCSGSIRFTHADCLEQWLAHSGKSYCELCGYKFEFTPLYDAAAPPVLPWSELVSTVAGMALTKWLPLVVRGVLVVVLWLGVAPWCTSWLYRMWLLRASAMAHVSFSERFDYAHASADILAGIVLIVVIVFSFLALMSFADFLRFHLDHLGEPVDDADHHAHHHHHHPQHQPNHQQANQQQPNQDAMPFDGVFVPHPREDLGLPPIDADLRPAEEDVVVRPGQELRQRRPLAGRIHNQPPPPPAAAAARPPPPPINNNRGDVWEDDLDHMEINIAMDELLGLRGDAVVLFRNVSWLLAFNGAYLGLFAFIPYTLGSTILSATAKILASLPVAPAISTWIATHASSSSEDVVVAPSSSSVGVFFLRTLTSAVATAKTNGDCLQLVDLTTCMVGYLSIGVTILLWRWMVTTASPLINRPLLGGAVWALCCLSAIVKVSTLLLLKMVALPIVLGVGMNVATLRLFQASLEQRISLFLANIMAALLVHWVLGITFMLFITVSVLQLREVMHPAVLATLIRPQEAHPDLLRSLLSETSAKHARRMVLSLAIYAALLVLLVHVPVRVVSAIAGGGGGGGGDGPLLQLRFYHLVPEIQVPLELLATHLVVLGILEHAKNAIGAAQYHAMRLLCRSLGLSAWLLPRVRVAREEEGEEGDQEEEEELVLAPPPLHFHPQAALPPGVLRKRGHRYLPWPEDGVDDRRTPLEYTLLPRTAPQTWLYARTAALLAASWLALVVAMGALVFGAFFLGRASLAPLERLTGEAHDPLALAAGVQIVWYVAHGVHALHVLTRPAAAVERKLLARGYCVHHMTPESAVVAVLGWAFVGPFLVGVLLTASFPTAHATWFESFWLGYLVFNLAAWLVCCFRLKKRRRRRRARQEAAMDDEDALLDDELHEQDLLDDDELELLMDDEELLDMDMDDDDEDDLEDEEDNHDQHQHQPAQEPVAPVDGILAALRLSYKQAAFNIHVHDNDAVRLRRDDLRARCFDLKLFLERALYPLLGWLLLAVAVCSLQAAAITWLWPAAHATAFVASVLCFGAALALAKCSAQAAQWTRSFAEALRNERYLIGRELQDMAR